MTRSGAQIRAKVLLGAGLALLAAAILFDSNWLRGPLEIYLARKSGREVRIGHLRVVPSLSPTVHVRDLYAQNAPWADSRPLIVAAQASFTFSLRSLWDERAVISRVVLVDAEVNLERRADGLRNWRLRDPEYAGPGKVKVVALEAHRTKLQIANHAIELHFAAAASDPPPDAARAPAL